MLPSAPSRPSRLLRPALGWLAALAVAGFAHSLSAADSVVISEFMAAGQYVIQDEDGEYSDWLELHNTGDVPVNLAGWHLSDQAKEPAKWTIPSVVLAPDAYLLIFADGKNRTAPAAPWHTNFKLNAGGEFLALTRPDGSISFQFAPYPIQLPDVSYDQDGRFLGLPTPGAANNSGSAVAMAPAPEFSEPHGLKAEAFALELSSGLPDAQIRYTLDGSEPTETHGEAYLSPLPILRTTVVRAVAYTATAKASPIATRTYLFLPDVITQSADGKPPVGWPKAWGLNKTDYGMDPRITNAPPYRPKLRPGLKAIPSISIVTPLEMLFSKETGIYANPQQHGQEWERAASIELINADGSPGFALNAGLRIRGGASRDQTNPKHSFRVFFRRDYGAPPLEYPLFGEGGTAVSDKFDLRCDQISSWHWSGDPKDDFIRDQWGRDTQLAMGQAGDRGDFYHLYINGMYWGLYNTQERHDAAFAAHYFGGSEEEYDVVKYDNTFGGTHESDGTIASWRRLHDAAFAGLESAAAYQRVQGNNPDGSRNPAYERLVDVDNLIDYMLLGVYSAASDNPPSFGTQNNWGAIKSRKGDFGYRFFVHDWELSMYNALTDNVVGEQPTSNPLQDIDYISSNVWHIWQALRFNADFRQRVADRVQRHFFQGGALTPEAAGARFRARMDEIAFAVVGESARWGDARFTNNDQNGGGPIGPFLTVNPRLGQPAATIIGVPPRGGGGGDDQSTKPLNRQDWLAATKVAYMENYFPARTGVVLDQLRAGGLYPALSAPAVEPASGYLVPGQLIQVSDPLESSTAVIYYTLDGSDPRQLGGAVAAGALVYTAPITLGPLRQLKARIKEGEVWSALVETRYESAQDFRGLQITELNYHSPASANWGGDDFDFIELKNAGATALDLSGLLFEKGVTYAFPTGALLPPGGYYVIGRNPTAFAEAHPGQTLQGIFSGRLSDTGEDLVLSAGPGVPLIELHYHPEWPWPAAADGSGFTLVRADKGSPNNGKNWRASTHPGGSPGADDPTHPDFPRVIVSRLEPRAENNADRVELANPEAVSADISGWWLTNDRTDPTRFRVPAGSVLPAGGTISLPFDAPDTGGDVYLFSADATGALTGYAHGFAYGASPPKSVFVRVVNSEGEERFITRPFGEVFLSEIHFHPAPALVRRPAAGAPDQPVDEEFVEIGNAGNAAADLSGWKLVGLSFTFPARAILESGALALVVSIDPETFRAKYAIAAEVPIFGPAGGNLQDDGEVLALQQPINFEGTPGAFYETVESVRYNDKSPWPYEAAGFGASLQRPNGLALSDDPLSWLGGTPTPGRRNTVNAPPRVRLTGPTAGSSITPPQAVLFTADAFDLDGAIKKVEFFANSVLVGTSTDAPYAFRWTGAGNGRYDLTARATDEAGQFTDSPSVSIRVQKPDAGAGEGLKVEYFSNQTLENPAFTGQESQIDHQWTDIDPVPGLVSRRGFSARWEGQFVPVVTGPSVFTIHAEGGVRLYLNDHQLVDGWEMDGSQDFFAEFAAEAGQPIQFRLEYRDGDGFAGLHLGLIVPGRFDVKPVPAGAFYLPTQDPAAFAINTLGPLLSATLGESYRLQFTTINGVKPVVFTQVTVDNVVSPGYIPGLPPGMALSPGGLLSGKPTEEGWYGFHLYATDAAGHFAPSVSTGGSGPGDPVSITPGSKLFLLNVRSSSLPPRPVLTVTSPAPASKLTGNRVNLAGSATSVLGLERVEYSLNSSPWRPMATTIQSDLPFAPDSPPSTVAPQAVRFSIQLDDLRGLFPGDNVVLVRAVDTDGQASATTTRRFHLRQFGPLLVTIDGAGTVSPDFLGSTRREYGQSYTVKATPGPGQILQGWQEGEFFGGGSERSYTFIMRRDLHLKAVFVPNPYPKLAGRFIATVGQELDQSSARGLIRLDLTRTGAFSAKLKLGGTAYPFSGQLDASGSFYRQLEGDGGVIIDMKKDAARDKPGHFGGLAIFLSLDFTTQVITASVNRWDDAGGFNVVANLQPGRWSRSRPCPLQGLWEVSVAGGGFAQPTVPGTGQLEITSLGEVTLTGTLGDGTAWTSYSFVDDTLTVPLYAALYDRGGSLSGDLHFAPAPAGAGSGDFFWEKPARESDPLFPKGFSFHPAVTATRIVDR